MRYIDSWLAGLGLDYIIPKLKANGITTPKKLALLSLRDMYEVVGVEDAEDRKKLYFLIQRLQAVGLFVGWFVYDRKIEDFHNIFSPAFLSPSSLVYLVIALFSCGIS